MGMAIAGLFWTADASIGNRMMMGQRRLRVGIVEL